MSKLLEGIKSVIAQSIKVEVKSPINRQGKLRYPILVTDSSNSLTAGWFIKYNPVVQDNGTRLYDGSESFSELHIAKFSQIHDLVLTGNFYFLQGNGVETLSGGRKRAIYQPDERIRLTVTSQSNSTSVTVTITDENSPFHMMSIPFTVVQSNTGDGSYYIIGTEKNWDRNTDTFQEFNANFAPRKGRFYRVHQQQNQPATLRAKIAVNNNQYAINHDGTFQVDTNAVSPEYIQVISNEYKALAYIYEQALMSKAFEIALSQGLPQPAQQANHANNVPSPSQSNFTPAFPISDIGQPNVSAPSPAVSPSASQPSQPAQKNKQGPEIDPNLIPWVTQ